MKVAKSTIILTGGGTGGHISPILAVADELHKKSPEIELIYVGEKSAKFAGAVANSNSVNRSFSIRAGKFRRYHGESWLDHIKDFRTILLNIRDFFYTLVGFFQSLFIILKRKPKVIFIKGGYVGVPIGLAGALLRIPIITHDSDTVAGLANRIIGKWAKIHAVGMPTQNYNYKNGQTIFVGTPVDSHYKKVDEQTQKKYRQKLKIPIDSKVLLITGGSQGAKRLNEACEIIIPKILDKYPELFVFHQTGSQSLGLYSKVNPKLVGRLYVQEFIEDMYIYSGASDIVITRAGASTIAELAIQAKACIVVPNPRLASAHQLQNAKMLRRKESAIIVSEEMILDKTDGLQKQLEFLLDKQTEISHLASSINKLAKLSSASELADLIINARK